MPVFLDEVSQTFNRGAEQSFYDFVLNEVAFDSVFFVVEFFLGGFGFSLFAFLNPFHHNFFSVFGDIFEHKMEILFTKNVFSHVYLQLFQFLKQFLFLQRT